MILFFCLFFRFFSFSSLIFIFSSVLYRYLYELLLFFIRLYERVFLTSTVCCVEKYTIDAYILATNTYKKLLIPSFVECCVYCMFRFIRLSIRRIYAGLCEYQMFSIQTYTCLLCVFLVA